MVSRRAGRVLEVGFRSCIVAGVVFGLAVDNAFDPLSIGPFHVTPTQVFMTCMAVGMLLAVAMVFVMPRKVWCEDAALMSRGWLGRGLDLAPLVLMPIAAILSNPSRDLHDELVLGVIRISRNQLIQGCMLTSLTVGVLVQPLYRAYRRWLNGTALNASRPQPPPRRGSA